MNKIEKIVRHYVKKFLAEALKDFDNLVETKVQAVIDSKRILAESPRTLRETLNVSKKPSVDKSALRQRLGVDEDAWSSIYADTLRSDNPILNEVQDDEDDIVSAERPEYVPEHIMEEAGLMRDFSKHMEALERKDQFRTQDNDLELKRREILNNTVKRSA